MRFSINLMRTDITDYRQLTISVCHTYVLFLWYRIIWLITHFVGEIPPAGEALITANQNLSDNCPVARLLQGRTYKLFIFIKHFLRNMLLLRSVVHVRSTTVVCSFTTPEYFRQKL